MNIHKLEKQATPGPLEILNCSGGDAVRLREGLLAFDRGSADARILIHCRNNFMRALSALKRMRAQVPMSAPVADQMYYDELIDELEEVKS